MNGGKGIYVGGTLVSILISLALYFSGKRESAIFVGLWAPTILNLGQTLLEEDEVAGVEGVEHGVAAAVVPEDGPRPPDPLRKPRRMP
jgi:hypothetical protein